MRRSSRQTPALLILSEVEGRTHAGPDLPSPPTTQIGDQRGRLGDRQGADRALADIGGGRAGDGILAGRGVPGGKRLARRNDREDTVRQADVMDGPEEAGGGRIVAIAADDDLQRPLQQLVGVISVASGKKLRWISPAKVATTASARSR